MSIGGLMRTSVSGMNAQATRLAGVADNIANANTTGYKRQSTEFSTMVLNSGGGQYNSGIVEANTRQIISQQGVLSYTTNNNTSQAVDLAVNGNGFLVVSDGSGGTFMTRSGAFVKNGNGDLVNAAGFVLQGYPLPDGDTQGVVNGFAGLQNVNLDSAQLRLKPTDSGIFRVNLPKAGPIVPTPQPGNAASNVQTAAVSLADYDPTEVSSIRFTVRDGTRTETVTIAPNAPQTVNDITTDDVVSAINTQFGSAVASKNTAGHLVLTSSGKGSTSSVELGAVAYLGASGATVTPTAGATAGLVAQSASGTDVAAKGTLPSANQPGTTAFTATDSLVVYDDAGKEIILDIYMTKKADGTGTSPETDNVWEYVVFDRAKAAAGSSPFPYGAGGELARSDITFDPSGKLKGTSQLTIPIPNGRSMTLDLKDTSQLGNSYQPLAASVNGNPPGNVDQIQISENGILSARFKSGELVPLFKIPLALVESPDNLRAMAGNVYVAGSESGEVLIGFGGESGLGSLVHGALEQSTVDLAGELTTMIESQRSYTANSKVFQTGSEILDVLVNLKR